MTLRRINDVPRFEDSQAQSWAADLTDDYNALPPTITFSDWSSPESNVSGVPGTIGVSVASGTTMLWIKELGSGNTGWASLITSGLVSDLSDRVTEQESFAYGGLTRSDGVTLQSVGPPTKLDFNADLDGQIMPEKNMRANILTSTLSIDQAGVYQIGGSFAFRSATGNSTWHVHCYLNGSETSVGGHRKIGTANDIGSMGYGPGMLELAVGDRLESRISRHDSATPANVVFEEAQLSVWRVG